MKNKSIIFHNKIPLFNLIATANIICPLGVYTVPVSQPKKVVIECDRKSIFVHINNIMKIVTAMLDLVHFRDISSQCDEEGP